MPSEIRKFVYENVKSTNYTRSYVNASFVTVNAEGDIVIDLCEEYAPPNMIASQNINQGQFYPIYEHDDSGVLHITREMKHSIVIPKVQARQLADYLHSFTYSGSDNK